MIRAVCFEKKAFNAETMKRICLETTGKLAGALIDPSMANCIESFPDGNIYFSYIGPKIPKYVLNCQNDVNLFIQANKFGGINKR